MNTQYNSSYIFSITLVATLGGLLFGYDTAVISGTVESLNTVFVAPQNLSESAANSLLGFCVASALIGCIIGGALGGYCSNRFGRRDSLKEGANKQGISSQADSRLKISRSWADFFPANT
ncbi:MFS transporter, partial [Escherichia coli]|uniref:MFS transporter n=1 Tax=Escherichia coli TaxID=562 RepID=UPI003F8BC5D7